MSDSEKKSNEILKQGTILAAASILVRLIGMLYQIPLTGVLEDGNGIYGSAFQVYSLALIISSYGLPLAVSKLVSGKQANGEYRTAYRIFTHALLFAACMGGLVGGIIFWKAEFFANLIKMPDTALPLRVLAPTIFVVAILGVIRGYFQGQNTMIPTAISQVAEQIVNAIVSYVAAVVLMDVYRDSGKKGVYGAAGSTLGTLTGALTAFLIMVGIYIINRKVFARRNRRDQHKVEDTKVIYKMLLITILPVILSQTVYQISSLIDTGLWGNIMEAKGMGKTLRTNLIGLYQRPYVLLLNVPLGIATAMGTSLIPSVVHSFTEGDMEAVKHKVRTVVKFNMLFAIPCAMGFTVLGTQIIYMLFPSAYMVKWLNISGKMFLYGAVALIPYALSTVTSGVLQALNQMRLPVIHSAISLGIHVVLVGLLLQYTDIGIYALIVGYVTFPIVVSVLNWLSVAKYLEYKQEVKTTFLLPVVASIFMGAVCMLVYRAMNFVGNFIFVSKPYINNMLAVLLSVFVGMLVYFVAIIKLKALDHEEILDMPLGTRLHRIAVKMHLMI